MCWYSDSWDGNFYIDFLPRNNNSFVNGNYLIATGGSGHGFKFAPVLGDLIADVLEGKPNEFRDLFKWRPRDTEHSGSTSERAADSTGPQSLSNTEMVSCHTI
jgi:sarcosine oxidase/L-pipecolate oxidase